MIEGGTVEACRAQGMNINTQVPSGLSTEWSPCPLASSVTSRNWVTVDIVVLGKQT